jgi:hypothetical protein
LNIEYRISNIEYRILYERKRVVIRNSLIHKSLIHSLTDLACRLGLPDSFLAGCANGSVKAFPSDLMPET